MVIKVDIDFRQCRTQVWNAL